MGLTRNVGVVVCRVACRLARFRDLYGGKFPPVFGAAPGGNQLLKIGTRPLRGHYPLRDCKGPLGPFHLSVV